MAHLPASKARQGFEDTVNRAAGGRTRRSVGQQTVSSLPPFLAAPRVRLIWRLHNFATNCHE